MQMDNTVLAPREKVYGGMGGGFNNTIVNLLHTPSEGFHKNVFRLLE